MKLYERCFNLQLLTFLGILFLLSINVYADEFEDHVGYIVKYQAENNKERKNYKELLAAYQEQKRAFTENNNEAVEKIGNNYIKNHRNVLKKHDYINDYTVYKAISYFLYVNAVISYRQGKFDKSNEQFYLCYYILDIYINDALYKDKELGRVSLANSYRFIFNDYLYKDDMSKSIKEIKSGEWARLTLFNHSLEYRKDLFTSVVERDPMDEVSYSHLYDWDWYQMELKDDNIENKPDFTNAAPFKILTKALRIRYTDESKAKLFQKFLKEKAGLEIPIKPWALGLKKKIPGNAWLTLIRSDELGKDLMKRYIFDLK